MATFKAPVAAIRIATWHLAGLFKSFDSLVVDPAMGGEGLQQNEKTPESSESFGGTSYTCTVSTKTIF